MKLINIVLLLLIVTQFGCMSAIATRCRVDKDKEKEGAYFGVRTEGRWISAAAQGSCFAFSRPNYAFVFLASVDMPITIVTDTLFLPIDIAQEGEPKRNIPPTKNGKQKLEQGGTLIVTNTPSGDR